MVDRPVVSEGALRDLLTWLGSWSWPLEQARVVELAEQHGWTTVSDDPGEGAIWETGLPGNKPWASVSVVQDRVASASVTTSEVLPAKTAEGSAFVRDVFADQVAVVTEVLGPPSEQIPGPEPAARWALPNGSELQVLTTARSCSWQLTSPEFVEIERDLGR